MSTIAEEVARIRAEALRPDREKLLSVAAAVKAVKVPAVSIEAGVAATLVAYAIDECEKAVIKIVEGMK